MGCCGSCGGEAPNHTNDQDKNKEKDKNKEATSQPQEQDKTKKQSPTCPDIILNKKKPG